MPRYSLALALVASATLSVQAQDVAGHVLSDVDFLVRWRDLPGQMVTINQCNIGGSTTDFVRCDVGDAGSFSLDAETMDRADLRFASENCSAMGWRTKPECRVRVIGVVGNGGTSATVGKVRFVR